MAEPTFKGALDMHEGAVAGFAGCRKTKGVQPGRSVDQLRNSRRGWQPLCAVVPENPGTADDGPIGR
jgi:hypothetical protein